MLDFNSIKKQRFKMKTTVGEKKNHDIAIIGVSFNLPFAKNFSELYNVLSTGKDCIADFPLKRQRDVLDYIYNVKGDSPIQIFKWSISK